MQKRMEVKRISFSLLVSLRDFTSAELQWKQSLVGFVPFLSLVQISLFSALPLRNKGGLFYSVFRFSKDMTAMLQEKKQLTTPLRSMQ